SGGARDIISSASRGAAKGVNFETPWRFYRRRVSNPPLADAKVRSDRAASFFRSSAVNQRPVASDERPDAPRTAAGTAARHADAAARRSRALLLAGKQGRRGQLLDALQTL